MSALPELADYRVEMAIVFVVLLTIANLRGIRESGTVFAISTYMFVFAFAAMIGLGLLRLALGDTEGSLTHSAPPREMI